MTSPAARWLDASSTALAQRDVAAAVELFEPDGYWRDLVFFDKRSRARLANTYAIVGSDGTVITVGHRYRRIPRGR